MGLDLYLTSKPEIDGAEACVRTLVGDGQLESILAKKKCQLFDYITYPENGDDDRFLAPAKVRAELVKAAAIIEASTDPWVVEWRAGLLEEIAELQAAVAAAEAKKAKVALSIA